MSTQALIAQFSNLSWREPGWLLLMTTPILIAGLRTWFSARWHDKQTRYADSHLLPWASAHQTTSLGQRLLSKNSAFIVAWLFLGIAAAGPRLPLELNTLKQPSNLDIMLVIDVSRSMHVSDIQPSRLRRAQIEIDELISRTVSQSTSSRFGVIIFAARPHLLVPLTADMSALRFYLRTLDNLTLPTRGSKPFAALELAGSELEHSTNPTAILMFSDGDFASSMETPDTSTQTLSRKTPLYILGLGTNEGAAIPLKNGQWLKHEGQAVISRLNAQVLQALTNRWHDTKENNERYSPATDDNLDWQKLYDNGIARLGGKPVVDDEQNNIIWQQLYHWPLFIAVLLLWISLLPYGFSRHLFSTGKHNAPVDKNRLTSSRQTNTAVKLVITSCFLISLVLCPAQETFANPAADNSNNVNNIQAFSNYSDKNYAAAISVYKQLTGYNARFGEGASHYKLKNYSAAIRQFSRAILAAENDQQRAAALFNLGNSYFQTGNYAAAITSYSDALKYQPIHKNTRHNLNFSIALKQSVEKRMRSTSRTARMGSGPQLSLSEEAINTNRTGSLAIDESESQSPIQLPELAELSDSTLEKLINKGLQHIQLAASQNSAGEKAAYQRRQLSLINARLRMTELEDEHTLLWKRLYEMEEGFPAPLAEPRIIPGVPAW